MNFNLDTDHLDEIAAAVTRVVYGKHYVNGPELKKFEQDWATFNNMPFAVGVGNGTDAIRLSLLALGIGPGDEVITPAFNAAYAAQAVASTGATNVYADVDRDTMLLDPEAVWRVRSPRTRAIIPVHLFGQMVPMQAMARMAETIGAILVEDASQAHGALHNTYGPGQFSAACAYSHYPTKNLGCLGEGGSVTTRLPIVAQRIRSLRDAGRTDRYVHVLQSGNSMLDEMQAAVLNVRLKYLAAQNERRHSRADYYRAALTGVGDLRFQKIMPLSYSIHHLFVVRTKQRSALLQHLSSIGIPALSHYPCEMTRQPFAVAGALDQGPFPYSEAAAREVISLPLWPGMSNHEQQVVVEAVKSFFA